MSSNTGTVEALHKGEIVSGSEPNWDALDPTSRVHRFAYIESTKESEWTRVSLGLVWTRPGSS